MRLPYGNCSTMVYNTDLKTALSEWVCTFWVVRRRMQRHPKGM